MITTCTKCGECYEAWSEEAANHPTRYCPECEPTMGNILHVEDAAEAAARRRLAIERTNAGLFAHHCAAEQPTPAQRIEQFDRGEIEREREWRQFHADMWRHGRRMLRQLPESLQRQVIATWNAAECPAEPAYFADHVRYIARKAGVEL